MVWLLAIRIVIVALLSWRIGVEFAKVRRKELPATRLALPVAVLAASILVANAAIPRIAVIAVLFVLDAAIIGICIYMLRALRASAGDDGYLESRLQQVFARFFPEWFARLASTDITLVVSAGAGLRAFISPPQASSRTYVHGSKIGIMAMIITLSVVPDAFLLWILLPQHLWWLAAVLDLLDVWACLWLFGLFGIMANRPHQIRAGEVVLRNGILQSVRLNAEHISDVHCIGTVRRRDLPRRRGDRSVVLSLGGVPFVQVDLSEPAIEHHLFRARPRHALRIFVASDKPELLRQDLMQARGSSPERTIAKASV